MNRNESAMTFDTHITEDLFAFKSNNKRKLYKIASMKVQYLEICIH